MQPADQHSGLDHRRLSAVEALERRVRGRMRDAADEARAQLMFAHSATTSSRCDRVAARRARRRPRRGQRPVAPSGETSGEDAHVIGEVRDRERRRAQVVERRGRMKRRQNPSLPFGDQAERRDMRLALRVTVVTMASRISGMKSLSAVRARSVWPASLSRVRPRRGGGRAPQSSGSSCAYRLPSCKAISAFINSAPR